MRRPELRVLATILVLGLLACGEQSPTRPSPAPDAVAAKLGGPAVQAQINGLINALFAPKDQGAIHTDFARIKNAVASGRTTEAETSIVAFVQTLLAASEGGVLQDPNGAQPPSIPDALRDLVNSVATFGGLPPPIPASNPFAGDGAVAVVGPAGGTVVSSSGFGGVGFPPGALPADVIVVVSRLPNPVVPGAGPLPTTLTQFPLFYDFSTSPQVAQFAVPVTVGICQLEVGDPFGPPTQAVADRLQLAHPDPANPGTVELLDRQLAAFISCNGVTLAQALEAEERSLAARTLGFLVSSGSRVLSLFRPSVAYAVHGGLGGRTTSFSPFAAVDPGLMTVGVCGSPMPGVLQTYPTVDIALANVAPGGVIRICPQTINISATYLVDKPVTIEGDDPQNPPQFIVNGTSTLVGFRVNPVLQGLVTIRGLSFTVLPNLLSQSSAIDLGLGQGPGNEGSWWQVVIENSQFTVLGPGRGVRVFQTSVSNPKLTIRNNQMSGGVFSIVTLTGSPTSTIEVLSNSFIGRVLVQSEANARVEGNTFTDACPDCIRLFNVGSGLVKNNTLTISGFFNASNGIVVQGLFGAASSVSVIGNSIVGTGGGGPPSIPSSYKFAVAAVFVGDPVGSNTVGATTVNVSGNTISNAAAGIRVSGGGATVTGADNVMSNVLAGLRLDNTSATPSSLTIGSSDFTSYFTPVQFSSPAASSTLVATCNWWGNVAGPQNLNPFTPASAYVPWATAPVANGAGGPCNGVAGTPSISIGGVTVSGSGFPVNLANVSGAIDVQLFVQPSGNTMSRVALFLDGNEVVQSTSSTLLTLNTLLHCNGPHVFEGRVFTVGGPVGGTPSSALQVVFNNTGGCAALLHWYPFNGAFTDAVGGATGVPSGGASTSAGSFGVTQRVSGILSLDGTTGYVEFASKLVPTSGSYTVALFARHRGTQATFIEFISQGFSGGPGFYIGHDPTGSIRATDSWGFTGVAGATADGKFHHYALVVDATANQSRLFRDGTLQATLNSAITTTSGGTATRLGRQFDPFTEFFAGDLDDIRVYQGALTASEVVTLAAGAPSPLTGTWQGQVTWSPSPGFTGEYVFVQAGTSVSGRFFELVNGQPFGSSLNLPLTISGQGLQFTLSWRIPPTGGGDVFYTLVGTITGSTMTGTASSTSGSTGTFSLTRIM